MHPMVILTRKFYSPLFCQRSRLDVSLDKAMSLPTIDQRSHSFGKESRVVKPASGWLWQVLI